jgi:type III secretion system YscQ/HrcQ family protein
VTQEQKETFLPLELPRISADYAALLNQWYRAGSGLNFQAADRTWRLTPEARIRPALWHIRVYAGLGDYEVTVFLDNQAVADWPNSGLELSALSALPKELAGPALELICLELVEALEKASGLPVSLSGCNFLPEEAWLPEEAFCFSLVSLIPLVGGENAANTDSSPTVRVQGAIAADLNCLAEITRLFSGAAQNSANQADQMSAANALKLQARLILPGPELTPGNIRELEAGDIVLTAVPVALLEQKGLPVRLSLTESFGASAYLKEATLHMESVMTEEKGLAPLENPAQEQTPAQEDAELTSGAGSEENIPAALDPKDIPLRLGFDLGGLELSVAGLAALAPGQVLETGRNLSAPVRIVVSGRSIGAGSMVNVAGQLGVRIESINL